MNTDTLLTVEDAAAHLKISKHTLNRWRVTGEGPPFIKYGPRLVRYLVTALDVWARQGNLHKGGLPTLTRPSRSGAPLGVGTRGESRHHPLDLASGRSNTGLGLKEFGISVLSALF